VFPSCLYELSFRCVHYHSLGKNDKEISETVTSRFNISAITERKSHFFGDSKHFTKQVYIDGAISTPKTKSGFRSVPIPAILLERLPITSPFELVFKSVKGMALTRKNTMVLWNSFMREMQIYAGAKTYRNALVAPLPFTSDLTPYYLRHTFATDLVASGAPIELTMELMGHKNISVTAKYYLHMNDERMAQADNIVNIMANR
jgi:integrase